MPEVKLVITAETAEALKRIQAFGRATEASFRSVKAALDMRGGLSSGFLEEFSKSTSGVQDRAAKLGAAFSAVNRVIPEAGGVVQDFASTLATAGAPLAIMTAALGLAAKGFVDLRERNLEFITASRQAATELASQTATIRAAATQRQADLAAASSGSVQDRAGALTAANATTLVGIENLKRASIAAAREEFQKKIGLLDDLNSFFGFSTKNQEAAERTLAINLDKIDQMGANSQADRRRALSAELISLSRKTGAESLAAEVARINQGRDLELQAAALRRTNLAEQVEFQRRVAEAAAERIAVQQDAEGRTLDAMRTRAAGASADLDRELAAFTSAQDDKVRVAEDALDRIGRKEGVHVDEVRAAEEALRDAVSQAEDLKAQKAEETAEKKRALLERSAAEERRHIAEIRGLYADLARSQITSAQEVLSALVAAGQAAAERAAALLEGRGAIEGARQIRLEGVRARLQDELDVFVTNQQDKVQVARDAYDKIVAAGKRGSAEATLAWTRFEQEFKSANDRVAAKAVMTAEKWAQAWEDGERTVRATFGSTMDLVQQLTGASDSVFASARAALATEEAQKLRDQIDQMRARVPELGGLFQAAGEQIGRALDLVTNGSAKNLRDALDQIAGRLSATAAAAAAVARAAAGFNLGPGGFFGGQSKLPSEGGGFFPGTGARLPFSRPGDSIFQLGGGRPPVPSFAVGGVVPGPIGAPMAAIVHGGETIVPAGGRGGDIHVHVELHGGTYAVEQALYALARKIGDMVDDQSRRRLRTRTT